MIEDNNLTKCINHPDQIAIGICINCKKFFCTECITRIEHKNYCGACLIDLSAQFDKQKEDNKKEFSKKLSDIAVIILSVFFSWILLFLVIQGVIEK